MKTISSTRTSNSILTLYTAWNAGEASIRRSNFMTRTVDIHVGELRRKLEADPSDPKHLLTVRKAGYRLQA